MEKFQAVILKHGIMGEKSHWTFVEIPASISEKINPGVRRSYRVKGLLDNVEIQGLALFPIKGGGFILPINASLRKSLKKKADDFIDVSLRLDNSVRPLNADLLDCLDEDIDAKNFFNSLSPSHQRYFSNWIDGGRTIETKTKRIAQSLSALGHKWDFGKMLREAKNKK